MAKKQSHSTVLEPRREASRKRESNGAGQHPETRKRVERRAGSNTSATRFGIGEANLARRREFIRLVEDDRRLLMRLEPWSSRVTPEIAREFYDWQFSFGPTLAFFEGMAGKRNVSLAALRQRLESSQTDYLLGIFQGAEQNWGVAYFEERLHVGWVHDQIDLPFKWYIGSYTELQHLVRVHLRREFKDAALVMQAEEAIFKVFNYDMQAIGDSFLLNTLESMGLNIEAIEETNGGDKTESLSQVKNAIEILRKQCDALAEGRLSDEVFEQSAPCAGQFGDAFSRIRVNFRDSMTAIAQNASALAASAEELTAISQQLAGNAEETSVQANVVSKASDEVSSRVSVVASSSEEMQASIREISKAANESASVARNAVTAAESANSTIHRLGDSSVDIGKVIKVITSIAQQTNITVL